MVGIGFLPDLPADKEYKPYRTMPKNVSIWNAKIAAMLWHRGESNSISEKSAAAYNAKLVRHIAAIRKDTGQADLLFILGHINPAKNFYGKPQFLHANIVRTAQQKRGFSVGAGAKGDRDGAKGDWLGKDCWGSR
jgi:hypothetical protein